MIRIDTAGFSPAQTSTLLNAVPQALGCRWAGCQRGPQSLEGVCRAWLANSPGAASLRLTPLTKLLHKIGAATVKLEVATSGQQSSSAPSGWKTLKTVKGSSSNSFEFVSDRPDELVPDFPVRVVVSTPWYSICTPIAFVLVIPTLVSCALRLRASRATAAVNWLAWTNWINLSIWLYWMTAMSARDLGELMVGAGFDSYLETFAAAALLYSLPPLTGIALAVIVLAPLTGTSKSSLGAVLKRRVLGEAVVMAPLGVFLVGVGLNSAGWGFALFGLVAAYVVFRTLAWFHWSQNYAAVTPLESGELFERASLLARNAGVALTRVSLMRTAQKDEANAFATSGDAIVLTEGLVSALPLREVDSVIAHELGHHKSGHLSFDLSRLLFWGYMLGAEPLFGWIIHRFHAPHWLLTLPIAPLLFMRLQSFISQRREFEADARGAEITGDPEGAIAALARMARLSHVPVNTGSLSGAILSHPSIQGRGLALARRFGIGETRALSILRDPDQAYSGALICRRGQSCPRARRNRSSPRGHACFFPSNFAGCGYWRPWRAAASWRRRWRRLPVSSRVASCWSMPWLAPYWSWR